MNKCKFCVESCGNEHCIFSSKTIIESGKTYQEIKYGWKLTILYLGEERAFVLRHSDNYECSYNIDFLSKNFKETDEN